MMTMANTSRALYEFPLRLYREIGFVSVFLGMFFNVASLIFLFWFRSKPIVAMGQPRLLAVMCVGSLLILVSHALILFEFDVGRRKDLCCKLAFWCFSFGDFAVQLIMFFKLYRVYKVMQFRRRQTFLPRHVILPFVVCLIVPMVFATLNTIRALGIDSGIDSDGVDRVFCSIVDTVFYWLYVSSSYLVSVAILVFAWRIRHVEESVGDARRILRWEVFRFFSYAAMVFRLAVESFETYVAKGLLLVPYLWLWLSYVVVPAIFLVFPRMYLVWYERHHGHLPDHVRVYGAGNVHVNTNSGGNAGTTTATNPNRA